MKGRKRVVVSLVERGGSVRSFSIPMAAQDVVAKIVRDNIAKESRLQTDESRLYMRVGKELPPTKRATTWPGNAVAPM